MLLSNCSLELDCRNVPLLRAHFRLSLWVHCTHGDILAEYEDQIEERVEMMETEKQIMQVDPLDVALRSRLFKEAMAMNGLV
jgi:hypothetical protein